MSPGFFYAQADMDPRLRRLANKEVRHMFDYRKLPDGVAPQTAAIHAGQLPSPYMENAEAIYLTSGFTYASAEEAEAAFKGDIERYVYSRYANPTVTMLEARLRERDKLQAERSRRFAPLARQLAENAEESALITMLLDDTYQQMLHTSLVEPAEVVQEKRPARAPRRDDGERSRAPRSSRPRRR